MRTITSVRRRPASATVTSGRQSTSFANRTDITFKRPPATAATWTRNDFTDLEAGGPDTSVHPPTLPSKMVYSSRTLTQQCSRFSRRLGATSNPVKRHCTSPRMARCVGSSITASVSQTGLFGEQDYQWSLTDHEIEEVRLQKDGKPSRGPMDRTRQLSTTRSTTTGAQPSPSKQRSRPAEEDDPDRRGQWNQCSTSSIVRRRETSRTQSTLRSMTSLRVPYYAESRTRIPALPSSVPSLAGYTLTEEGDASSWCLAILHCPRHQLGCARSVNRTA